MFVGYRILQCEGNTSHLTRCPITTNERYIYAVQDYFTAATSRALVSSFKFQPPELVRKQVGLMQPTRDTDAPIVRAGATLYSSLSLSLNALLVELQCNANIGGAGGSRYATARYTSDSM